MKNTSIPLTVILLLSVAANSTAAPVQWTTASGGNNNWYDIISTGAITALDARNDALARGGHLATITSSAENSFVFDNLVNNSSYWVPESDTALIGPWLGGYQPNPNSPADSGWEWITSESWSYTNWYSGEPNDDGGPESYLHYYGSTRSASWNDADEVGILPIAFVIEYSNNPTPVPLPAAFWLLGSGLLGLVGFSRRKKAT